MTDHRDPPPLEVDPELVARWRIRREQVEPAVAERLGAARRRAVALLDEQTPVAGPRYLPWAAGFSGAALLLMVVTLWPGAGGDGLAPLPVVDAEEMAAAQDLELLADLEFLAWLDEQQTDHAPSG